MASPPSADFSFTAPFPALKQRRVSLALPASTPRIPWSFRDDTGIAGPSNTNQHTSDNQSATESSGKEPKKGKIRKTEAQDPAAPLPEKKPRKKWSPEETQMLVDGCNRHGVGNWKTILSDPTLKFDNRSPVDLKDRFRTYFPDAYKKHYPNARTHLSSKVRSTLPDGSSLFEKTRSKRRRPFTEEEDRALKAGYEKHGTVWATIVKDPIFQEQNRRSTDLRDRFRNAFPELYQAAGYKPRNNISKKKKDPLIEDSRLPPVGRAATDDQLALSSSGTTGPVRGVRRRRAQTSQGILLRGGTKSVPQSTACSEDEDSSGPEDEDGEMSSSVTNNVPKTPLSSMAMVPDGVKKNDLGLHLLSPSSAVESSFVDDDDEMGMRLIPLESISSDPLSEYPSSNIENHPRQPTPNPTSQHTGINTPTHTRHTWPSPQNASSNVNDGGGGGSNPNGSSITATNNPHAHSQTHPTSQQDGAKIGQSAWGPQDWLSANPRLDHSFTANGNGNNTPGTGTPSSYFSPSSPFTSYNLTPLNTSHTLSPPNAANATSAANSTTANSTSTSAQTTNPLVGNITNLTTLNLPMNMNTYINYYNSHQHHGVIERYDLWPPSSSALSLSSPFSAVNNSSSSALSSIGSGGGFSGPFSSESFAGDLSSEVSFSGEDTQSAFSDEYNDEVYNSMGYVNPGASSGTGRAITHHSDYAGDLIFGARGYGIGGGFGWFGSAYASNGPAATTAANVVSANGSATALGLMGIPKGEEKTGRDGEDAEGSSAGTDDVVGDGKGSINPMQLHAHTPSAIDEIALADINLNDSQDVDEEMHEVEVEDDAMDGSTSTRKSVGIDASNGGLSSPGKRQSQRSVSGGVKSNSAGTSPQQPRRVTLGHMSLPPLIHPHQQHSNHPHAQSHHLQHPHTPTHNGHNHSLSLSIGPNAHVPHSSATTPGPGMTPYGGRFSLDDLDLIEFAQAQTALVDINNLTPPATPVMHHAVRGSRKYSMFGVGLGGPGNTSTGAASTGGLFVHAQGGQAGTQQGQGQGGRSISVPPGEARNGDASSNASNSLGMSFGPATTNTRSESAERGRTLTSVNAANGNGVPNTSGVKRSLSSTVHHSHGQGQGPGHGHSLSMSTFPPFPSHSEIWRSKTPVAKTTSTNSTTSSTSPSTATATTGTAPSLYSGLFSPPPSSSPSTVINTNAPGFPALSGQAGMHINADAYTNPDLPFLDLHYNFGHQNQTQQQQQGFGAMLVDTPSTTAAGTATTGGSVGMGMTQAELEARQALDLAQPFYMQSHGHHGHAHHAPGQGHSQNQGQGLGFGFASGTAHSNGNTTGGGLKTFMGNVFNTPLNLTRQFSQFSAARQGQQGHQRVQSQQVVNPKDLVLNAGAAGSVVSGDVNGTLRMDNKRKRASWDGGLV